MNIIAHMETLSEKHLELEQKIKYAHQHHLPVLELKRHKLKIKDEIERLSRMTSHSTNEKVA